MSKKFSFNINSSEFVPSYSTPGPSNFVMEQPPMLFPDNLHVYNQQVAEFLDFVLNKENLSVYFPETYVQYQENREIVVTLNSIVDLLVKHNITPVREVVQSLLSSNDKVIYDGKSDVVKIDPDYRTCIVLRDFCSPDIDINQEIWEIFGDYAHHIVHMNPDLNLYYVWFDSSDSTNKAFAHLDVLNTNKGRKISAFIKSDTYKSVSFINPFYENRSDRDDDNEAKKKKQEDQKNTHNTQQKKDKKNQKIIRPTHIAVGDDFPPLENVAKGGYDREFKKYTVENLINLVSKKAVPRPETESPDCPALLSEQNVILEQSKKLQKSKDPFFLPSGTKSGNRRRKGKKGNNKQNQNKKPAKKTITPSDSPSSNETRYADVVKEASPVKPKKSEDTVPTDNKE